MNQTDTDRWKSEVLNQVFQALISSPEINESLIFKGARILNLLLKDERQSLDIDSNLAIEFTRRFPLKDAQQRFLEHHVAPALSRYFNRQEPVRYELKSVSVEPSKSHPRGWDSFTLWIGIIDHRKSNVRSLPSLEVDIAAPEELNNHSIAILTVGANRFCAYTAERIAGEKMRAFLSTLSSYRKKMKKPGEAVRAKDLHDLVRILRAHPIREIAFWKEVGIQFKMACKSRYVDCAGWITFQENWEFTKAAYEKDARLKESIPFAEAESALHSIVSLFENIGIVPLEFPLPE
ncbi:MAG: nucleotidyl transferase AbiEii/AbiGii toxin family protein [Verrucomicrobiae bacterium]|nr:nucleotidyl transferase AbiEii/AbiGii toxin family protein [Verrucomicrobiae bacterium]